MSRNPSIKLHFLQQGRSEVICPIVGSLGVSQIRVKAFRDFYRFSEVVQLLYKIDNSMSKAIVAYVEVKLIRLTKVRSQSELAEMLHNES